jgi:hypothetical protein
MKSVAFASLAAAAFAQVDDVTPPFGYNSQASAIPEGETGNFVFDMTEVSASPYPPFTVSTVTSNPTENTTAYWPMFSGFTRVAHFHVSRNTLNLADEAFVSVTCGGVEAINGTFTQTSADSDLDLCLSMDEFTDNECIVSVSPSTVLLGDFTANAQATSYVFDVSFMGMSSTSSSSVTDGGCPAYGIESVLPLGFNRPPMKESLSADSHYFMAGFDATEDMSWAGQSTYITMDATETSDSLYALVDPTGASLLSTFQLCYSTNMPFDETNYFGDYSMGLNTTICDQGCYPNADCTVPDIAGTLEDQSGTTVTAPLYATLFAVDAVGFANAQTAFAFGHFPDAAAGVAPSVLAVFAAALAISM